MYRQTVNILESAGDDRNGFPDISGESGISLFGNSITLKRME